MSLSNPLDLAKIDPELEEILKNSPPVPNLGSGDIPTLREYLRRSKLILNAASTSKGEVQVVEEDRQIPVRDGSTITVRIHSPKNPPARGSPVLVVYHGGGFCLGGQRVKKFLEYIPLETPLKTVLPFLESASIPQKMINWPISQLYHDTVENEMVLCRNWTTLFGGVAVNVDYRLAPEFPFPTPVYDAYDALKWTAANLDDLKVDAKKGFILGGISSGGNFAAVLSHLYQDEGISPPLTGLYISIPVIMEPQVCPEKYRSQYLSREQNKDAPILGQAAIELYDKNYKPDIFSPLCSPILFASHKHLPPTLFQICGMDPLRDEALIYEGILREEYGVSTKVQLFPGLPHGFWNSFPQASFTKKHMQDSIDGLKWLVEQGGK